jgi:hypothetical protein
MDTLAQIIVHETTGDDGCLLPSVPVFIVGTSAVETRPSASTTSSVNASVSSTTVLASNSSRRGATVYNDSTAILYLKLGSGSSSTSFAVRMSGGGYYEVPFGYTGIITGTWSSATGSARVTELS